MPLSLAEYAESLDQRDLIWPQVPAAIPVKAKPSVTPLADVRVVLWDVYGTLLRTPDGGFTLFPEPELRLHVALEKTIQEFNMWNSMYRKPGPPWQSLIQQYRDYAERLRMLPTKRKGDFTDVNSVHIWRAVVDRLFDKDYIYDSQTLGDADELSEKIAWFFHRNLQATIARPDALQTITEIAERGILQGIFADGQPFTLLQLTRDLQRQGLCKALYEFFPAGRNLLSWKMGIRKPSQSLYQQAILQLQDSGVQPHEILHVSCRLQADLIPAKAVGMKTALLAAEKIGLEAASKFIKDPQTRPDRLLTEISQVTAVVGEH